MLLLEVGVCWSGDKTDTTACLHTERGRGGKESMSRMKHAPTGVYNKLSSFHNYNSNAAPLLSATPGNSQGAIYRVHFTDNTVSRAGRSERWAGIENRKRQREMEDAGGGGGGGAPRERKKQNKVKRDR